jgi:Tol biopolymer transport system component
MCRPTGVVLRSLPARTGGFELWVADADGSRRAAAHGFQRSRNRISSMVTRGTRVAFHSYAQGKPSVYVVSAEGGKNAQRIAEGEMPFWSRDVRA